MRHLARSLDHSIPLLISGGYSYNNDADISVLANRTLYWRTHGDSLELIEVSLNFDLVANRVKYRYRIVECRMKRLWMAK